MNNTIFKIKQIAGLVIFIIVLSMMGMITGKPVMMLAYAAFFLAVSTIVYLTLRKRQRHFEVVTKSNRFLRLGLSAILMILAIILPLLIALRTSVINLPAEMSLTAVIGIMLGITILFILLIFGTIVMINRKGVSAKNRVIGYSLFVLASILPGLLMSKVDSTTMSIGSVYYVAMAVLILVYNSMGLFWNQE